MWKNLISGIYLYLIVAGVSGVIFGYSAYSWTSDYYIAKIEHANVQAMKEKDDIQIGRAHV